MHSEDYRRAQAAMAELKAAVVDFLENQSAGSTKQNADDQTWSIRRHTAD
jgi:hypothetical protein